MAADGSDIEFTYDTAGRPVRSVRRNGAGTQITSMRYADGTRLRPSMAAMPGKIRAFVYDEAGNPTGVSELTTDDPTGARGFDASTAGGQKRTYGMTYDSFNHLKTLQVYTNGVLSEYWHLTTDASGNSRSWIDYVSNRTVGIYLRDAAHRPLNLSGQGVDVTVGYDVRGRVSKFWYIELATQANGYVQRRLTVSYGYSPDGRVVSRTGSVSTNNGAEVPISSGEIDLWLDNYEAGVIPAGPAGGAVSLLKALGALPEPGLEPVCVECWISQGIRWAAGAVSWGMSVVGRAGGECATTPAVIDQLSAAANEMHTAGQLISKAGRGVTKHPDYFGFKSTEEVRQVYRTNEQLNEFAGGQVVEILKKGVRTEGDGGPTGQGWVTYTKPDGVAASWTKNGEFIGFRGNQRGK